MLAPVARAYNCALVYLLMVAALASTGMAFVAPLSRLVLTLLGVQHVRVFGRPDPSARVVAFNHPSLVDALVINAACGPVSGLVHDRPLPLALLGALMRCVQVTPGTSGQRTTARLRAKLASNDLRYAVAVNRPHDDGVGGRTPGDRIDTFKTIAFRLGEAVQPAVIVTDHALHPARVPPPVWLPISHPFVAAPLARGGSVRVYLLPKMVQKPNETPDAFAGRVQRAMNRCLARAWQLRPTPDRAALDASAGLVATSLLMTTVALHALARKQWLYAGAWLGLTATSVAYHGGLADCGALDKAMVATVVALGLLAFLRLRGGHALPLAAFVAVAAIYYGQLADHTWVHLVSMAGHHALLLASS